MKATHTLSAAMVAVSLLTAGCASNAPTSTNYSTQADAATYGTIENIQVVRVDPATSGAGAVAGGLLGALVGNQIGSGSGRTAATAAGAIGGAVAGNQIESNRNAPHDVYQITVRLDNGDYRTVNQDSAYDLRSGSRVRLVDGRVYRY
ncbi:outer membrane lipoprotein SlyB [Pseudoduganella flava]|uniref:Glycine zipper 2TM domain-containing protein n=1 Tax=Pseudoduganella flava TaxID=871742 RepID=A0A562PJ39_9BURK|nr:glycine zipper 2TM domain-containing protein [Pseudoduganella flava]QGZ42021.1 glycine zipper 2TM domain-containing protein [Pseudoduganella flava]TWI44439.1 outer membrane lipoprotein SlyB [Pseudoduganella flava]